MAIIKQYTPEDLKRAKEYVQEANKPPPITPGAPPLAPSATNIDTLPDIRTLKPSRPAFNYDSPVQLHMQLYPDMPLYPWQEEELMRYAGYHTPGLYDDDYRFTYSEKKPYIGIFPCANGSGKDMILLATSAIWTLVTGHYNRFICTSASKDQLKAQTEIHIRHAADRFNEFHNAKLIEYVEFHFVCRALASEIKLFATDKAGRAEGYHPFNKGKMTIAINEAKTIESEIISALLRCNGYDRWLVVSSPGEPRGYFYNAFKSAIQYPNKQILGHAYARTIDADSGDCPHISEASKEQVAQFSGGRNSALYRSSIRAQFVFLETGSIISEETLLRCKQANITPTGTDIGIGLDIALGGGDFTKIYVRQGNRVVYKDTLNFKDPTALVSAIDNSISPYKATNYVFNSDAGGMGAVIIRLLITKGWRINERNNQSPAFNKTRFLNLGAEMWVHTRNLILYQHIILPLSDPDLEEQLTRRRFSSEPNTQGRQALEPKKQHKASGNVSPDDADAFILAFYSYALPSIYAAKTAPPNELSPQQVAEQLLRNPYLINPDDNPANKSNRQLQLDDLGQTFRRTGHA